MKKNTAKSLVENLNHLMDSTGLNARQISERSGISPRAVAYYISGERVPDIEMAEKLAKVFGLEGWHLIMPNLPDDLKEHKRLRSLLENYNVASKEGKDHITMVAEREARYGGT